MISTLGSFTCWLLWELVLSEFYLVHNCDIPVQVCADTQTPLKGQISETPFLDFKDFHQNHGCRVPT